jgi:FGGY-family pentulose kinase
VTSRFYLGIDVGTRSARAGIFDAHGVMLAMASEAFELFQPAVDFAEHSSSDIWRACCVATRAALSLAKLPSDAIVGIGFDATCSLVILGANLGTEGRDVIVWMDHRAVDQARRINATKHRVLDYVGGVISPEMEMPKLLWLKENLPETFARAKLFMDLPDFLAYRATDRDVRSLCTTVCKWTYLGHESRWDEGFLRDIGLAELATDGRIGTLIRPMGERAGTLTEEAARELGLAAGTAVSVSIIDAHSGGLGLLGEGAFAMICGTSTCHMAVSREPKFVPGVWGPYFSAMVPDMWLNEGGQSATGALIDYTIESHARGAELAQEARTRGTTVYELLNERLDALAARAPFPADLARDLHVLPYHHGNRSPRADPTLRGMVSGLSLASDVDALALLYLATMQAIAHGTRQIIDALRDGGHDIRSIAACGGDTKNRVFLREHADATGCPLLLPKEPEAVLLGSAILGRVACGDSPSVRAAMADMSHTGERVEPAAGVVADFHANKHKVFLRMYDDHVAYRGVMGIRPPKSEP